jgi:protein-disulfide isomerase
LIHIVDEISWPFKIAFRACTFERSSRLGRNRYNIFMHLSTRGYRFAFCALFGAVLLFAQADQQASPQAASQPDWKTADNLPGVDFSGLSPVQTRALLRLLRIHDCACGCGMKVAECRVKDPPCSWSKGLAGVMADTLRAGKSEDDAIEAANASHWAHGPQPPKLLEDPVNIPTAGSPVKGPAEAPVTLVEFSDFQCPYCWLAVGKLDALMQAYPQKIKLIFKEFPLDTHSQAALAAQAAIAANRQGKFWPMHDALFAHRTELSRPVILALARMNGLNFERFVSDLDSSETRSAIARDLQDGDRAGVEGTPTVFIDGQKYNGSLDLPAIRTVIEAELKKAPAAAQK